MVENSCNFDYNSYHNLNWNNMGNVFCKSIKKIFPNVLDMIDTIIKLVWKLIFDWATPQLLEIMPFVTYTHF